MRKRTKQGGHGRRVAIYIPPDLDEMLEKYRDGLAPFRPPRSAVIAEALRRFLGREAGR